MSDISQFLSYIPCTSKEFDKVATLIRKSSQNKKTADAWCIVSIDKVKNSRLEEQFAATKADIAAKRGNVLEVRAFHGTTEGNMAAIVADGFDPTQNKRSAYGRGTYVAPAADYARRYAQENQLGDNVMLICRCLLGIPICVGNNQEIPLQAYDYGVDSTKTPNMYVIPYRYGVIPEYVVQFYGRAVV